MNFQKLSLLGSLTALAVGSSMLTPPALVAQEQAYEELTRGPVHEAFAASVNFDPEPGLIVPSAPPTLIDEIPPEQRLEGDNVAWIPGYWGWDEEQNDFLWISGVWRQLPPGRQWVPGYWNDLGGRWQWTSGYWADEAQQEVSYYSPPPRSIESGPNVAAPSSNHIWISGTWIQRNDRYAWRPGYWERGQENWIWIPAHYQWTPRGYVFIEGYWDYDVPRRGVVFAPVRFRPEYYNRPRYSYTPLVVISLNVFVDHLFVRPRYNHYYFGDYYSPRYRDSGFYASYSYRSGRDGYDPIDSYRRWAHRDDRDWERTRRERFEYYRDHESARPPITYAALMARPEDQRRGRESYDYARPLDRFAQEKDTGMRFEKLGEDRRRQITEQSRDMRKFRDQREKLERSGNRTLLAGTPDRDGPAKVERQKFDRSPVVAKRPDQLTGKDAPPEPLERRDTTPAPDSRPGRDKDPRNTADRGDPAGRMTDATPGAEKGKPQKRDNEKPTTPAPDSRPGRDKDPRNAADRGDPAGRMTDAPRSARQEGTAPKVSGKPEAPERNASVVPQPQRIERKAAETQQMERKGPEPQKIERKPSAQEPERLPRKAPEPQRMERKTPEPQRVTPPEKRQERSPEPRRVESPKPSRPQPEAKPSSQPQRQEIRRETPTPKSAPPPQPKERKASSSDDRKGPKKDR